ncbi:MAG TPA: 5-formyltetrahydrofolate cyclo-ligase [Candidatus Atribacteria bacterium]|nr:5-formyltetrahydrofolate cyclo-ligase [Candidatus Atribacteria bacterium]
MVYASIGSEVRTLDLISRALLDNKILTVPLCMTSTRDLKPCRITGLDDLAAGTFGIPEPVMSCEEVDVNELDIVIVPGVAFDTRLNRLGHGAGYYDRFLARLSINTLKIGLAYDFQVVDSLPVESHDISLDMLITDKRIITGDERQEQDMDEKLYRTGEKCIEEGLYQCQLSMERQYYKKGDIFDYCSKGHETRWKKIE